MYLQIGLETMRIMQISSTSPRKLLKNEVRNPTIYNWKKRDCYAEKIMIMQIITQIYIPVLNII